MSKPKPSQKPADAKPVRAPYDTSHVNESSSQAEVSGAKIAIIRELMRRRSYAELQSLRAELAEMPPVPGED
jgi:hypothetical protein